MFELNFEHLVRVNRILADIEYIGLVNQIENLERERIYCLHGFEHFLSVARIATILNSKLEYNVNRELIYAAALLHDIGRVEEYRNGIRHELASAEMVVGILGRTGFTKEEIEAIRSAIANHRNETEADKTPLDELIYKADKLSRNCFFCNVAATCSKASCKRNLELVV